MGLFIAQLIGRPLAAARELLDSVALGDLSKRAEPSSKDEVGQMMKSLNSMIQNLQGTADTAIRISEGDLTVEAKLLSEKDLLGTALQKTPHNLRSTVREVSNAADNVASGSHGMSATAQQLSQGS